MRYPKRVWPMALVAGMVFALATATGSAWQAEQYSCEDPPMALSAYPARLFFPLVRSIGPVPSPTPTQLPPPPGCMPAGSQESAIVIVPGHPAENDAVRIILGGTWLDTCVPKYEQHQRTGNVIRVDLAANYRNTACGPLMGCWEVAVEVGLLPRGQYTVEVYIHVLQPDFAQVYLAGTGFFTVYPAYAGRGP